MFWEDMSTRKIVKSMKGMKSGRGGRRIRDGHGRIKDVVEAGGSLGLAVGMRWVVNEAGESGCEEKKGDKEKSKEVTGV